MRYNSKAKKLVVIIVVVQAILAILGMGVLGFGIWVIVQLLQYFQII